MSEREEKLQRALERIAADTSAAIVRNRKERPTSLLDLHSTVIGTQIAAREALEEVIR